MVAVHVLNGNILRISGPLCGESMGHRWTPHLPNPPYPSPPYPHKWPVIQNVDVFFDVSLEKLFNKQSSFGRFSYQDAHGTSVWFLCESNRETHWRVFFIGEYEWIINNLIYEMTKFISFCLDPMPRKKWNFLCPASVILKWIRILSVTVQCFPVSRMIDSTHSSLSNIYHSALSAFSALLWNSTDWL